ncbi:MAG: DNA-directed RNA polymerase subunit L [Thermoplasmata archaeon]|nr:DNA-directed RNA polymerase subunit L [Thermoplasmata archaeon]
MQVILIEKGKNSMKMQIEGEGETMLIPLRNQLIKDSAVDFANYNIRHPKLDIPIFNFVVNSGKPQNALKKASKALSNQYKDMLKQIKKQS